MKAKDFQLPVHSLTTAGDKLLSLKCVKELVHKLETELDNANERISELENQWISVEDRFPDNSQNGGVLAINDEGDVFLATSNDGWWCIGGANPMTHWMPLPAPPKEQSE